MLFTDEVVGWLNLAVSARLVGNYQVSQDALAQAAANHSGAPHIISCLQFALQLSACLSGPRDYNIQAAAYVEHIMYRLVLAYTEHATDPANTDELLAHLTPVHLTLDSYCGLKDESTALTTHLQWLTRLAPASAVAVTTHARLCNLPARFNAIAQTQPQLSQQFNALMLESAVNPLKQHARPPANEIPAKRRRAEPAAVPPPPMPHYGVLAYPAAAAAPPPPMALYAALAYPPATVPPPPMAHYGVLAYPAAAAAPPPMAHYGVPPYPAATATPPAFPPQVPYGGDPKYRPPYLGQPPYTAQQQDVVQAPASYPLPIAAGQRRLPANSSSIVEQAKAPQTLRKELIDILTVLARSKDKSQRALLAGTFYDCINEITALVKTDSCSIGMIKLFYNLFYRLDSIGEFDFVDDNDEPLPRDALGTLLNLLKSKNTAPSETIYGFSDAGAYHGAKKGDHETQRRWAHILKAISSHFPHMDEVKKPQKLPKEITALLVLCYGEDYVAHLASLYQKSAITKHKTRKAAYEAGSRVTENVASEYTAQATLQGLLISLDLAEKLHNENVKQAIGLIRPPGHHAQLSDEGKTTANGFCFINTAFLVALYRALNKDESTLILDLDAHHGDGTQKHIQDMAETLKQQGKDGAITLVSVYGESKDEQLYAFAQAPAEDEETMPIDADFDFYIDGAPCLLRANEDKTVFALCLPANCNGANYNLAVNALLSYLKRTHFKDKSFGNNIISAGLDSHKDDGLVGLELESTDFKELYRIVAEQLGKLLVLTEGGYAKHLEQSVDYALQSLVTPLVVNDDEKALYEVVLNACEKHLPSLPICDKGNVDKQKLAQQLTDQLLALRAVQRAPFLSSSPVPMSLEQFVQHLLTVINSAAAPAAAASPSISAS